MSQALADADGRDGFFLAAVVCFAAGLLVVAPVRAPVALLLPFPDNFSVTISMAFSPAVWKRSVTASVAFAIRPLSDTACFGAGCFLAVEAAFFEWPATFFAPDFGLLPGDLVDVFFDRVVVIFFLPLVSTFITKIILFDNDH